MEFPIKNCDFPLLCSPEGNDLDNATGVATNETSGLSGICQDLLEAHGLQHIQRQGPLLTLVAGVQQSVAGNEVSTKSKGHLELPLVVVGGVFLMAYSWL